MFNSELCVWARASHPLARNRAPTLTDLQIFPWILPPKHVRPRRQFENAFLQQGLAPPPGAVETTSLPAIQVMLREADWLTLLPSHVFLNDENLGHIVRLPVCMAGADRPIGIARRAAGTITPAARALTEHIKRSAREFDRSGKGIP